MNFYNFKNSLNYFFQPSIEIDNLSGMVKKPSLFRHQEPRLTGLFLDFLQR